mmetsp:Transcript_24584/g.67857  ORF Transcript_24584/g.67857 Transcript_24584/m.67857 type:complete len:126 (+) Transcript_24584:175-552(+)
MAKHGFFLRAFCGVILCLQLVPEVDAFSIGNPSLCAASSRASFSATSKRGRAALFDKPPGNDSNDDEVVEVGTKEYYSGFLSSPIQDETVAERGTGLEQALKLAGGVVLLLVVLVAGFMASNGLL